MDDIITKKVLEILPVNSSTQILFPVKVKETIAWNFIE